MTWHHTYLSTLHGTMVKVVFSETLIKSATKPSSHHNKVCFKNNLILQTLFSKIHICESQKIRQNNQRVMLLQSWALGHLSWFCAQ